MKHNKRLHKALKISLISVVSLYALYVLVGNIVYRNLSAAGAELTAAQTSELAQNTVQRPQNRPAGGNGTNQQQQQQQQQQRPTNRPQSPSLWERLFGRCRVQLGTGQQTQDDVYRKHQNGMYDGRRAQQESDQAANSNDKGVCLGWRWEW